MKILASILGFISLTSSAIVPVHPGLFRAPAHDSAIIRSDRLGGNFAYSIQEGHAYQAVAPIVQHVRSPVAVSYSHPSFFAGPVAASAPIALKYAAPFTPSVEVKEVKPFEVQYKVPQLKYYAAPAVVPHFSTVALKAAKAPVKPLVYYDAPKVEVEEGKSEYEVVAPYAQPAYAHAIAL
ncbi:uncharacterized protein LOC136041874 [Artemia franciscana]|uniref:Cuticle protein n=1 Tax=Artemia franciscana TaxID=6661 RepID=A0AA88H506_ARTSF|nr:hypothetical protein QYM36_018170 [Artemia franciscana]